MSVRAVEEVSSQVPADDFHALEEKIYRTIELYKAAREARAAAERDSARLREQAEEREEELETLRKESSGLRKDREEVEALRKEVISLRREREEVRVRVEKMLRQIEAIGEEAVAG